MAFTLSIEKIIIGGGVMQRKVLYDKIRKHLFEKLAGYLVHEKLESVEKLKEFVVEPSLEDKVLGVTAAGHFGFQAKESIMHEPFSNML
mmetsp:Transcript_8624/g.6391  ORF Transcript_8624/g.6391 Transcript_8624/m.6391 type:complete len:89 (+) Transcript_8624:739-1005(+)